MKLQSQKSTHHKPMEGVLGNATLWLSILILSTVSSLIAQENEKASPGAGTFKSKCVLCHGAVGSGNTPLGKQLRAADLRSRDVQKKTDAELHRVVHDGRANMPPFSDKLRDEEIDQVIKYMRALGKGSK